MTQIEYGVCMGVDEICIGIYQADGEDENGGFHMVTLGFIFFTVDFYIYQNSEEE